MDYDFDKSNNFKPENENSLKKLFYKDSVLDPNINHVVRIRKARQILSNQELETKKKFEDTFIESSYDTKESVFTVPKVLYTRECKLIRQ